jgi:hypothetical protein
LITLTKHLKVNILKIVNEECPEQIKVLFNKIKVDMPFESVVSSLTHQILSKNAYKFEGEQYYYFYESTIIEVREYLLEKLRNDNRFVVNLFGNWNQDFLSYQEEKSRPFSKDLVVTFSDGSEWSLKIIDLISLADNLERDSYTQEIIVDTKHPLLENEEEMMKWASENLDWNLLSELAEEIKRPQPEPNYVNEWKNASKRIVSWDDKVNMFDIISLTSINESDDEDDS